MRIEQSSNRKTPATTAILSLLFVVLFALHASATEKIIDKVLFPHDAAKKGVYRWSEGSTISLDGKQHLMMLVTALGFGGHDDTPGDILRVDSYDGGLTWTPQDKIKLFQPNIGKANVMSPSLLRLDERELLCFFMVKHKALSDCGTWMKRSLDNGKTWSEPVRLPYEGYGGVSSDRAYLTSKGRIILPSWVSMDKLGSTHVYCHYSDDRGKTWKKTALLSTPKGSSGRKTDPAAEEPTVVELKDGRLMMFMRVYLKSIFVSYSSDDGATWSKPQSSGIPAAGAMPTLRRMPGGDLLLIWNWAEEGKIDGPWPRNRISSAVSSDEGKTWTSLRHLDGGEDFAGKITMANVAFCDGNAVVTYSKSMTMKNAYSWHLQVIPIKWFYEGDKSIMYGEAYRPTLENKIAESKQRPTSKAARNIPRPTPDQRHEAFEKQSKAVQECKKQSDLIAVYSFDEGGGSFVYDLTGKQNDLAVIQTDKSPAFVEGKAGKALKLDGKGGSLIAPHSKSMAFEGNAFTVNAWVYPTQNKSVNAIANKEYAFQVAINDGKLQAAVFSSADRWGSPGWVGDASIALNKWSHIAVSFDGKNLGFMVNSVPVGIHSRQAKMAASSNPLVVGNISHINDSTFAGKIDELRISNKARKQNMVVAPYTEQAVRSVDRTHQLFIDDALIARSNGIERVVNQPSKYDANPVLTWDKPWEGNCVLTWGSIVYEPEEKLFKAWYEVYKKFPPKGEAGMLMCYATSRDGIKWDKPNLGLHEFRGSKENNIIMTRRVDAATVFRDPKPTAEMKYRMYWYDCKERGVMSAISVDGIHWKVQEGIRVQSGDRMSAGYDPIRKKYYVITRIRGKGSRTCGLWESVDGMKFSFVKEIAAADSDDPAKTQFYGMITFAYQGLHIGFLEPFFIPIRKLDTQLMYSRDGVDWHRGADRQTFLPWGPAGTWDQAWVTPSHNPPIRIGERLYIFYQGRQTLHWAERPFGHIGSVGLAFLRPDGFVSMETQWNEGTVTTAPLQLKGDKLHVNAVARPGTVCGEVLDLDGNPIEGYTRQDAVPMEMVDSLDHVLAWKGGASLAKLAGKTVRVRFYVRGAKLFSFWSE